MKQITQLQNLTLRIDASEVEKMLEKFLAGVKGREGIFGEVSYERDRQDAQWGGPGHDDRVNSGWDWPRYIYKQANLAERKALGAAPDDDTPWRYRMIKIAALAIAAVESHDRVMGKESNPNAKED